MYFNPIFNIFLYRKQKIQKMKQIQDKQILLIDTNKINCECGDTFYTNYPFESYPPCDRCPSCKKLHYEK